MKAPSIVGMIIGFLLLDERDDRMLAALMVTPMSLRSFLVCRINVPVVLGFIITVVGYLIGGLAPVSRFDLMVVALLASFNGPITALSLAYFAENKVTGFGLIKVLNTINMVPVAAFSDLRGRGTGNQYCDVGVSAAPFQYGDASLKK